ncbi:receptor-like protein EIX1 [Andrographis paniculata]|uniref:receptor-like protein EIX1 n=1 Tax=Andrographis paniculata TaxID=175694 RepID=UPI0021E8A6E7|nr:receptor-like protein EIX1 [Andrographis paniculata]
MVKVSLTSLLTIVIFLITTNLSSVSCNPKERRALQKFQQSLSDPYKRLSTWNGPDYCGWEGVTCDNVTGHVVALNLHNKKFVTKLVAKELDSSLFELGELRHLDLSFNDFQHSSIPEFLGSMKQLEYLNLSFGNFGGIVPRSLGNLLKLRILDLYGMEDLVIEDLAWASNLTSLEVLDLTNINLSRTNDLMKVFGGLPFLERLVLTNTGIGPGNLSPDPCSGSLSLASVRYLHLSWNSFRGEFPCFVLNMTWLRVLALSDSGLMGRIPELLGNFSSLTELYLSYNEFNGRIPESLTNLTALTQLHLCTNNLSGPIPSSIGRLRGLRQLSLDHNKLSGEVPVSLGQLSNLDSCDVSWNSLNGTLSEGHFANLSMLRWFAADYNALTLNVRVDWIPPFRLRHLSIRSIKVGGRFPRWLRTQSKLTYLELTNTSIYGDLPKWLSDINFTELHTPQNRITGPIPDLSPTVRGLDLSDNMLNGSIPLSICKMRGMDILDLSKNHLSGPIPRCLVTFPNITSLRLSSNELTGFIPDAFRDSRYLEMLHVSYNNLVGGIPTSLKDCKYLSVLDIGNNKLSETLPEWIGSHLPEMVVLRLRNNNFSGAIPRALCQSSKLQILDLANNNLTGQIPTCFGNLSGMIKGSSSQVIPYAHWYDESYNQVLKGSDMEYVRVTTRFVVNLDLSNNKLVGEIPPAITNLSALIGFNLSRNHLGGRIPEMIGNMEFLESMDLSYNDLFGAIPSSLSELSYLSRLNLSHNNLSGQIPTGRQLQTLHDPSMYGANPGLCGDPLPKKCPNVENGGKRDDNGGDDDDDGTVETIYLIGVIVSGFGTGFWGFIGVLVFKKSWRETYFRKMERIMPKLML